MINYCGALALLLLDSLLYTSLEMAWPPSQVSSELSGLEWKSESKFGSDAVPGKA